MTSIIVMLTEDMHSFLSSRQALSDMLQQPLFSFKVNMQKIQMPQATISSLSSLTTNSHIISQNAVEKRPCGIHIIPICCDKGMTSIASYRVFVCFCFQ